MARAAEASGWEGIVVPDHVVHPEKIESPYPYTADGSPRWDAPAPWPSWSTSRRTPVRQLSRRLSPHCTTRAGGT